MYQFWGRLQIVFFYHACFSVCPQQLLILFSLNSCWLNLFKLGWDEYYQITLLRKKHLQLGACTLYAHGIFLYMVLNMTKTESFVQSFCREQKFLVFMQCSFWESGNWFSATSLNHLAFSWNFYLLCFKLVGLLPCLNISPLDKVIFEIWMLLFSQKSDD